METTYVDRYREELSDIFSRIIKIDMYFSTMKKQALSDYQNGLISEEVYKQVRDAGYRTVLTGAAAKYGLTEQDRLLVIKYARNVDDGSLYLDDLNASFNDLIGRMDEVAYSVKTYHKYYSMDVEALRASVIESVKEHHESKKAEIEAEIAKYLKEYDGNGYETERYKILKARLDAINDTQAMMIDTVMVASYKTLINYVVKKFNINETYWNWYRTRENKEELVNRSSSSVPFANVLATDTTIIGLNDSVMGYEEILHKLLESYQLSNQFAQEVAMINNVRKVIVNKKCSKRECLGIFAKFYELPVFCEYIASYAPDLKEISSNQVFDLFYTSHFRDVKSVDYEVFRTTLIKEVFKHYKDRIDKYTRMLRERRADVVGAIGEVKSANNNALDSIRLMNDLVIDITDGTDYLGDIIPRDEHDRLYYSLREYFKTISTGNDAFKKTFC